MKRIGILGGTFNPVHNGHLAIARDLRERLQLQKILFIPSNLPPHKSGEAVPSAAQRYEMVRLAVSGEPSFELSDMEIKRGGRSYTIDTVKALHASDREAEFFFITGLDAFLEIKSWFKWQELLSLCAFVVISRPGYHFSDLKKLDFMSSAAASLEKMDKGGVAETIVQTGAFSVYLESIPLHDVSATEIRAMIQKGSSVKKILPEAVETYIIKNKIYA